MTPESEFNEQYQDKLSWNIQEMIDFLTHAQTIVGKHADLKTFIVAGELTTTKIHASVNLTEGNCVELGSEFDINWDDFQEFQEDKYYNPTENESEEQEDKPYIDYNDPGTWEHSTNLKSAAEEAMTLARMQLNP